MNEKDKELKLEIGNEIHRLKYGFYLIGRNTNDVEHHIPINDKSVDIKHAILEFTQNETIFIDLCSKNGTYVDDLRLKIGEHYKLPVSSSLSIKFGNILGHLCITSKEDYADFNSPPKQQNNISDIVPPSPERNISQTSLRSRLLALSSKFNSSSQGSINKSKSANLTSTPNSSILVASTQPNTSIYRYNENIRKNIELLEEDDDFYIPETQEVFNRENHRNSIEPLNNEQEHQKQHQNQKQNRIFDETESIMRICTQDFNVIDERTTDSDDLLRNVVMPIDDVNSKKIAEEKTKNIFEKNDKKIVKNVEIRDNFSNDNNEDDIETDCEEEMSELKWNESSSNKSKLNVRNSKSTSITPELDIENNFSKCKKNDELKSGSVTPDLDVNQLILQSKNNNSEKLHNKIKNIEDQINLSSEKINNSKDSDDDDDDDDEFLGPTQPFIRKPFSKVLTPIDKKSDKLLSNISPSNKENSLHNSNTENNDDSLEETQIFIFDKNKYNTELEKTVSDSVKQRLFIDSDKQKSTDNFLKPSLPITPTKNNSTNTPKSIPQLKMGNCDNNDNDDDDDDDDDDDMLGPTQIFEHPDHIKVMSSKSDSKSSSSIVASTTAAATTTTTTTKEINDDIDDDDDDDEMLGPTQIFEHPAHIKVKSLENDSKSSSSIGDNTLTKIKNDNNKISAPAKSFLSPSENTSLLSQFNFDICTPNWDNLKLPPVEKIEEAGKIFSEISKNQKHNKCIFEESSSSEDSNDEDFFKNHKNIKIHNSPIKNDEKSLKKHENTKNKKESINIRKNEINMMMSEKHDVKIEKDETIKSKNKQVHVILTRYNSRKINEQINDNNKNKKIEDTKQEQKIEQQNQLRTRSQRNKKKIEEKSSKIKQSESEEIKPCRKITRRLNSKDLEIALIDKSNYKRGNDGTIKDDLPNKRKKINETSTQSSASSSSLSISKSFQLNLTKPKIVFTKVDSTKYKTELKKIDAKIVTNPLDCTILVAEQIYWTSKLMAAMAKGIPIVTPNWIKDASKLIKSKNNNNSLLSIEDYILNDQQSEIKYKFNLRKSLSLAREKPIFDGYSFFITPKTKPPPEELKIIIICGKGKVLRSIPKQQNINNFYVVSDKDDMILWHKIRQNYKNVQIINTDGILMAALQQKINFKNYLLS